MDSVLKKKFNVAELETIKKYLRLRQRLQRLRKIRAGIENG
jgi:hypothetical protein